MLEQVGACLTQLKKAKGKRPIDEQEERDKWDDENKFDYENNKKFE